MWWVLAGSVAGLVASSLMIVCWFFRLRSALTEKGLKYTSKLGVLVWIMVLFMSVHVLLWKLGVIQKGGTFDSILMYTSATLNWIALVTVAVAMIFDAVKRRPTL
jgi:hypothetical protein